MAKNEVKNEVFEDLQNREVIFRNFAGKTDAYNMAGKKQFSIVLTEERAQDLSNKGWNVKLWRSKDGEDMTPFLPVEVNYGPYPPKCYLMSGTPNGNGGIDILNKTLLNEETIVELDHANFEKVDIIVSPYQWEWNGRSGIKAYAKAIYATVALDPLELKYANVGQNDIYNEDLDEGVPFN